MLRTVSRRALSEIAGVRAAGLASVRSMPARRVATMARMMSKTLEIYHANQLQTVSCTTQSLRSFSSYPPHEVLTMPALSPTMEEGGIVSWEKKVGDEVKAGDVMAQVATDKANVSFDSTEDGFIAAILVPAGSEGIKVGTPVAILVDDADKVAAFKNYTANGAAPAPAAAPAAPAAAPAAPAATPAAAPASTGSSCSNRGAPYDPSSSERVFASPAAKAEAASRGINISQIAGTGPGHRVVKADVLEFKPVAAAPAAAAAAPKAAPAVAAPVIEEGDFTDVPLSNMRKVIAQRLTQSKQSTPHYYVSVDVQMDNIMKLRSQLNKQLEAEAKNGAAPAKISVNDFVIKATAAALMKVPEVNCSWQGSSIRQYNYADISVAVATPTGLITPIIANAQDKGLLTITQNMKDLAKRARDGKLAPAEYQGGTFTISNLGMFGVKHFTAIINPPQAGILAVGGSEQKVVPNPAFAKDPSQPQFKVVNVMTVTASFDHRVVDGAVGAQWLAAFREYCEDPMKLLL